MKIVAIQKVKNAAHTQLSVDCTKGFIIRTKKNKNIDINHH